MRRDKPTIQCLLEPPVYGSPVYGEKLLCYEMLLLAIGDFLCVSTLPTHHSPAPSHITAADWIFESNPADLYSFEYVTEALGLEVADVRRVILKMARLAVSFERPRNSRSGWYLRELFTAAAENRAPRGKIGGAPLQPRVLRYHHGNPIN